MSTPFIIFLGLMLVACGDVSNDTGTVGGSGGNNDLNNPDALAAATQLFYSRDFDTQSAANVLASPVVSMLYQATNGYQGSGAWRALPQPINAPDNEDNVGWAGSTPLAVDQARRVVYS